MSLSARTSQEVAESSAPDIAVAQAVISRAGRLDRLTMALAVAGASVRVETLVPPYGGRPG